MSFWSSRTSRNVVLEQQDRSKCQQNGGQEVEMPTTSGDAGPEVYSQMSSRICRNAVWEQQDRSNSGFGVARQVGISSWSSRTDRNVSRIVGRKLKCRPQMAILDQKYILR